MELVGHEPLDWAGWWGSMGLCDTCAYIGSYTQPVVPIVDVSDPEKPLLTGSIALAQGSKPVEVRAVPEHDLLVVADLGLERLVYQSSSPGFFRPAWRAARVFPLV
jgi:hypothetical protein